MEAQSAIAVTAGRNYVQLRVHREPDPFFFCIDEAHSNDGALIGDVVDKNGKCLQPNATIERSKIVKVTRAILSGDDFPFLIPVDPISPTSARR